MVVKIMPVLFERVIYHIIADESHFKWEIYNNNSWMPHMWHLPRRERLKKNNEQVAKMEPATLYYPFDVKFLPLNLCFAVHQERSVTYK